MRKSQIVFPSAILALALLASPVIAAPDWNAIGQAFGKTGTVMAGGVYRVGLTATFESLCTSPS
jgi:hypothetical protein